MEIGDYEADEAGTIYKMIDTRMGPMRLRLLSFYETHAEAREMVGRLSDAGTVAVSDTFRGKPAVYVSD